VSFLCVVNISLLSLKLIKKVSAYYNCDGSVKKAMKNISSRHAFKMGGSSQG